MKEMYDIVEFISDCIFQLRHCKIEIFLLLLKLNI